LRRKLTTLVAIDMVGYARLLSEDESAVLATLDLLRTSFVAPKARQYGGQIIRFIGDGNLLEFESALGAVEFALDLQRSLAERNASEPEQIPIVLRMGVNLGDVVIENDDVHGDGLNIAVRLEALSEPGGLCMSESVYAQVKNKIQTKFVSMGPRSLKNIADPVHVWRWRPSAVVATDETLERLERGAGHYRGQHMLDPRIVDLILRLHARSVLLAVSDTLDLVADEQDAGFHLDQLYRHLGEELHEARELLNGIRVQRKIDRNGSSRTSPTEQTMGEFVASAFRDGKLGYAFQIIPEAQSILTAEDSFIVKRKRLLNLVRRFHDADYIARSKQLIEYAYIE